MDAVVAWTGGGGARDVSGRDKDCGGLEDVDGGGGDGDGEGDIFVPG